MKFSKKLLRKIVENTTISEKLEISTKMLSPYFWADITINEFYYKTSQNLYGKIYHKTLLKYI